MVYAIQFAALLVTLAICAGAMLFRGRFRRIAGAWLALYGAYFAFLTGTKHLERYPARDKSPYRLPWQAGVSRFVGQGNRSFVSHRDFHEYAWDFVMPNGTEVLAARAGKVVQIEDAWDGIGWRSNVLVLEHEDGERSAYAHIRHRGALVRLGDLVRQGQPIAWSGMVGQTLFPHLHFYVIGKDGKSSIPISFQEVDGGVPLAGRSYVSSNVRH